MGFLDDILGGGSSTGGGGGSGLLSTLISSGLSVMGTIGASREANRGRDADNALARDKFEYQKGQDALQLELEKQRLAQAGSGQGAAAALAKKRLLQEAYQMLIEAGQTGTGQEITALNNMLNAAQRPLLR